MEDLRTKETCLKNIEDEELQIISAYLQKMYAVWNDFGISEEQKIQRGMGVWKHIRNLLEDILEEEKAFYKDIKERIENYTKKIEMLSKELSMPVKEDDCESLIKREEILRQELDILSKIRHKRLKTYHELRSVESVYCSVLGVQECQLSNFTGVPSENDLIEIDRHIHQLTAERDRRHKKFCVVKKELTTILEATELSPETSFEKEILSSDSDSVSLTNETFETLERVVSRVQSKKSEIIAQREHLLDKLAIIWDKLGLPDTKRIEFLSQHVGCKVSTLAAIQRELQMCEKLREEDIRKQINVLRKQLKVLWDKCYVSDAERKLFVWYNSDEAADEVVHAHKVEIKRLESYYEEVKHILIKIEERKDLWDQMLMLQNKVHDPDRFKNRKGSLLLEEKERKRLQKDLPALENAIFDEIDIYEANYNKKFYYYGEDYRKFVINQWEEHNEMKENKKKSRQRVHLIDFDKNLKTPIKKPLLKSPQSAPGKLYVPQSETVPDKTVYYTPVGLFSNVVPNSNQRCDTPQKFNLRCRLFQCNSSVNAKKEFQQIVQSTNTGTPISPNGTTYSDFESELTSTDKCDFQSSVLAAKNTVASKENIQNPYLPKSAPTRGKLGLPFIS